MLKVNLSNLFSSSEINKFLLEYNIFTRDGGIVSDLLTHWKYIQALRNDLNNLLIYEMGKDTNLINFPLHNIIFSQIYFLADNLKKYLLFFFLMSLILPYIFYKNLNLIYKNINKETLILISSLILIFPAFQYSAIWGSSHITALCFFLIGSHFYLKFEVNLLQKKKYIILALIFFAASAYTKQFYAFIFIYVFLIIFLNVKFRYFFYLSIFTVILAIPGLLFLLKNPLLYYGIKQEVTNLSGSILISSSICFFYIAPFFIQYILNVKKIDKIFDFKLAIVSLVILLLSIPYFFYDSFIGGGIFYKLSANYFNSNLIFYIFAYLGIYLLLFFTEKKLAKYTLTILFISTFSTGFFIFQKYFEPLFLIMFFLFFNKQKIKISINKNNYITVSYFLFYYFGLNYIYFVGL